jgi:hypothetical protein
VFNGYGRKEVPAAIHVCELSALWSHFVFGVKEPLNFRRNGASSFAA